MAFCVTAVASLVVGNVDVESSDCGFLASISKE
jgi:hypothetical protein